MLLSEEISWVWRLVSSTKVMEDSAIRRNKRKKVYRAKLAEVIYPRHVCLQGRTEPSSVIEKESYGC